MNITIVWVIIHQLPAYPTHKRNLLYNNKTNEPQYVSVVTTKPHYSDKLQIITKQLLFF